jgi:hypothetical protein
MAAALLTGGSAIAMLSFAVVFEDRPRLVPPDFDILHQLPFLPSVRVVRKMRAQAQAQEVWVKLRRMAGRKSTKGVNEKKGKIPSASTQIPIVQQFLC